MAIGGAQEIGAAVVGKMGLGVEEGITRAGDRWRDTILSALANDQLHVSFLSSSCTFNVIISVIDWDRAFLRAAERKWV